MNVFSWIIFGFGSSTSFLSTSCLIFFASAITTIAFNKSPASNPFASKRDWIASSWLRLDPTGVSKGFQTIFTYPLVFQRVSNEGFRWGGLGATQWYQWIWRNAPKVLKSVVVPYFQIRLSDTNASAVVHMFFQIVFKRIPHFARSSKCVVWTNIRRVFVPSDLGGMDGWINGSCTGIFGGNFFIYKWFHNQKTKEIYQPTDRSCFRLVEQKNYYWIVSKRFSNSSNHLRKLIVRDEK